MSDPTHLIYPLSLHVALPIFTLVEGWGKLVSSDTIEVNGTQYRGKNIVLATGSYARSLPGLEIGGRVITSDEGLTLDYVPKNAIVLGGGVIGVEFARDRKSTRLNSSHVANS